MQESEDEEREGIVEQLPHHVRSNLTLERERESLAEERNLFDERTGHQTVSSIFSGVYSGICSSVL